MPQPPRPRPRPPRPPRPPDREDEERRQRCRRLLDQLRRQCPEFLPGPPPQPGGLAPPVALQREALDDLLREALTPSPDESLVVWRDGDSEVLLHAGRTRVAVREGVVAVALLFECEETGGPAEVVVPFAVGSDERPAGMIAATERRPRGPAVLIDRWGEAIIATAWEALLDIAAVAAANAGDDVDGEPLRAGALLAAPDALTVVPQARHDFERAIGS